MHKLTAQEKDLLAQGAKTARKIKAKATALDGFVWPDGGFIARSKKAAANLLGVSRQTIYDREAAGTLQLVRIEKDELPTYEIFLPEDYKRRWKHAYLGFVDLSIESEERRGRYIYREVPMSQVPDKAIPKNRKYTLEQAGVRLKHGRDVLTPVIIRKKGWSVSKIRSLMGDGPGQLKSIKLGGRRLISEGAIREYEDFHDIPEPTVVVPQIDPNHPENWKERLPQPSPESNKYQSKVLYYKPLRK